MSAHHLATLLAFDADGRLAAAIDALYDAFAAVPRPPAERVGLADHATPLRDLPAAALDTFARRALTTLGNTDALRWALPRLVELSVAADADDEWPDVEIVLGKLGYEGAAARPWWTWADAEREAVARVLHAWWRVVLDAEVGDEEVDRVLCAIGCCDPDIDPYLDEWMRTDRPDRTDRALEHLLAFVERNAELAHTGRLRNSFWTSSSCPARANRDRVIDWLAQFR